MWCTRTVSPGRRIVRADGRQGVVGIAAFWRCWCSCSVHGALARCHRHEEPWARAREPIARERDPAAARAARRAGVTRSTCSASASRRCVARRVDADRQRRAAGRHRGPEQVSGSNATASRPLVRTGSRRWPRASTWNQLTRRANLLVRSLNEAYDSASEPARALRGDAVDHATKDGSRARSRASACIRSSTSRGRTKASTSRRRWAWRSKRRPPHHHRGAWVEGTATC